MILNAIDEVLFWTDIEKLKRFVIDNAICFHPKNSPITQKKKEAFLFSETLSKQKKQVESFKK